MSKRYFLDSDGDHWHLIPCDRVHEWDEWLHSDSEEAIFEDCRIAGAPRWVTFTEPVDTHS